MTFVLKGALMENVALLNGFSTTYETRTVDDSKTSTLNLWTTKESQDLFHLPSIDRWIKR